MRLLLDLVENDADIGAWYRKPAIIDPNGEKTSPYPAYIIITTQAQSQDASLLAYKDWMWQRGYVTTIHCIEDILPEYSGRDNAEKMREFIKDKYTDWGTSFFLFLGHEDNIPFRYWPMGNFSEENPPSSPQYLVPCDLYFISAYEGDWNGDNDPYWGELRDDNGSFDYSPEAFVGRVLAKTVTPFGPNEVANWVNKVMTYERGLSSPYSLADVVFVVDTGFERYADSTDRHYPAHFEKIHLNVQSPEVVKTYLNNDPPGWLNIFGHGSPLLFMTIDRDQGPFGSCPRAAAVDLSELTNTNRYSIVYSQGCDNAAYDDALPVYGDTTICEGFLEAYSSPYRGSVAFIGATREASVPDIDIQWYFLDILFWTLPPNYLLGPAHAYSLYKYNEDHGYPWNGWVQLMNLFGSPLTEVWTNPPAATRTTVSPSAIPSGQSSTVTVTVKYNNGLSWAPLPNARVTLYGCDIYRLDYTNAQGQVSFNINPPSAGTIVATATKHDYKPSWANITLTGKGEIAVSDDGLPQELFMFLASSNPVKGDLNLQLGIPLEDEGLISLKIYDVSGRSLQTVFSEEKAAGYYDLSIPLRLLSTGTYFLRLEAGAKARTTKVVIR